MKFKVYGINPTTTEIVVKTVDADNFYEVYAQMRKEGLNFLQVEAMEEGI